MYDVINWLREKPVETQVWFVARPALRAFPGIGNVGDATEKRLAFSSVRVLFYLSAISMNRDDNLQKLQARAGEAFYSFQSCNLNGDPNAALAVNLSRQTAWFAETFSALKLSDALKLLIDLDDDEFQSAVDYDSKHLLNWDPLWTGTKEPPHIRQTWEALKRQWEEDDADWSFWVDWYEGILCGAPIDWALIQQIAIQISGDEWDAGPKVVGERVSQIRDEWLVSQLPQHEVISEELATGKFEVTAEPFDETSLIESALKQIEFSLSLAVDSNTSDFNRMSTAYKYLSYTLDACRADPNAIEQNFGIARSIINSNLNDPEYLSDESLKALSGMLEQQQLQIRADHPKVREAWEKRIAQSIREIDQDAKIAVAEAIRNDRRRAQSGGRLDSETELDAVTVESEASVEAQATAMRRATSRSAKMNVLQRASQTAKDVDSSGGYKAVRIGTTGYTLVDIVIKFFGG